MHNNKGTIIFIVSLLSQPRCIKRVTAFLNAGYKCIVYGYDRGVYDVNSYPEEVEVRKLGTLDNGEYLRKFKKVQKDISSILKLYKSNVLYYAFGFSPALFLSFKNVSFAYELSDVWYAYPRFDKIRFILKCLDKWIIQRSKITLMTSGGFCQYFNIKSNKILLHQNKISSYFHNKTRISSSFSENISFGFIGSIRYKNIFRFAEVIGSYFPNYTFNFYGGGDNGTLEKINEMVLKYPNVKYWGKFKNPEDLERIYHNIDIVVACYDNDSLNERIAEPNKLYEALFFAKPIIVSQDIYLAKRVEELGCGYTLDASSSNNIQEFIKHLSVESIKKISMREMDISLDQIIDNPDNLIKRIDDCFKKIKS